MSDPLPAYYYTFFQLIEPLTTIAGAIFGGFMPEKFALDLLPPGYEQGTAAIGRTLRGSMMARQLGSCFFLLSMLSFFSFRVIKRDVHPPQLQEKLVTAILVPLALADLTHILATLVCWPQDIILDFSKWTPTMFGNLAITLLLFAHRCAWFAGVARGSSSSVPHATTTRKSPRRKVQ